MKPPLAEAIRGLGSYKSSQLLRAALPSSCSTEQESSLVERPSHTRCQASYIGRDGLGSRPLILLATACVDVASRARSRWALLSSRTKAGARKSKRTHRHSSLQGKNSLGGSKRFTVSSLVRLRVELENLLGTLQDPLAAGACLTATTCRLRSSPLAAHGWRLTGQAPQTMFKEDSIVWRNGVTRRRLIGRFP